MSTPARRPNLSDDRIRGLVLVGAMVVVMWAVEVVNSIDSYGLNVDGGILPRHLDGLDGVLFAPFLHASWSHLIGNTIPFVILGGVLALSGLARVILVTAIVAVVGGLGTWLVAPSNTVHIGASGLVFGYAAFIVARGALPPRSLLQIAAGLIVVVVWGTTLLSGLAPQDGISWQGHLFGALGGLLAAFLLSKRAPRARPPAAPSGRGRGGAGPGGRKTPEQLLEELKAI